MQAGKMSGSGTRWRIGEWRAGPNQLCRSPWLQTIAILLALTAAVQVLIAEADGNLPSWGGLLVLVSQLLLVVGSAWVIARRSRQMSDDGWGAPVFMLVALSSLLWYGVQAAWQPAERTLELRALLGLRNLLLALAAFSGWMRYQRLAVLLSFFVTLFAATVSQYAPMVAGMVAFASLGAVWLYLAHWHDLQGTRLDTARRVSWSRRFLVPAGWCLLVIGMLAFGRASPARATRGFLPSSGGDRRHHAAAKGGVFDGDSLVAGTRNIQSFAPIEDAPFLPDHKPSLYDTFNDLYDEPVISQKTERTIPLPPEMGAEIERRMAVSEQAARQFATRRQSQRTENRRVKDIESHALFYVAGETPLHLRLEAYDLFDGVNWYAEPLAEEARFDLTLEMIDQRPWQVLPCRVQTLPVFRGVRTHAVKLVHFESDRVPAPIHLRAVHIDMLDRGPMFYGRYGGFVHIDRESIPPLVPIHLVWDVLDVRRVAAHLLSIPPTRPEFTAVPETAGMKRVRSLARQWTDRIPRGWRQINEVVERLRTHCEHDRQARPDEEDEFPLEHFLFTARRGPDYQFATAAALMLRSLGYASRVVSGFYVSPERYDPRLRHTPVLSEDVHFWTEVYLGSGIWAPLEPTPGYELLGPPPTWLDRLHAQFAVGWQFLMRSRWTILLISIIGMVAARNRWSILDWLQVRCWSLWPSDHPRRRILAMLRILERRGHWAGLPRPRSATWRQWLTSAGDGVVEPASLNPFLVAVDWAAFAPAGAPSPMTDHRNTCHEVLRQYSLARFREARRLRRSVARPDHACLAGQVPHPTDSISSGHVPAPWSHRDAGSESARRTSSAPRSSNYLPPNREG